MSKDLENIAIAASHYYDEKAQDYAETDRTILISEIAAKIKLLCLGHIPCNVIELGVGTGRYFPFVYGNGTFVGIDISMRMIEQAWSRINLLRTNGFFDVQLLLGDIMMAHDMIDLHFDFVYAIGVLGYHLPLDQRTMELAASLLVPGGKFFVTTVQQPFFMKIKNKVKHWLMRRGLPAGHLLSSYACSPSEYSRLAMKTDLQLLESLIFKNESLWNGLPQCGAVFAKRREKNLHS